MKIIIKESSKEKIDSALNEVQGKARTQVIPYEMIVQRAIDLQNDEKRIQDAKKAFEKMIAEIETKYKAFEFHPDYYDLRYKNF